MSDSCGKASKLPTPLAKRPAQPALNDNVLKDVKRSRLDLNHDSNFANRRHMRRSKSVTSLNTEVQTFRNESNDNFKRPGATTRGAGRIFKAPSNSNLAEKPTSKMTVSAPTTRAGKRPAWDLKGRVEDQENALKLTQKTNAELQSTMEMLRQQLTMLQECNKQEKQTAISKSNDCLQLTTKITNLMAEVNNKNDLIQELEKSRYELTNTISTLRAQLGAKDEQLGTLHRANCHLTSENSALKAELVEAKSKISTGLAKIESLDGVIAKQEQELIDIKAVLQKREREIWEAETIRRKLHNEVQELKGNIRVYCRVRPLRASAGRSSISFPENNTQQLNLNLITTNNKVKKADFTYDRVFCPSATQTEVFSEISQLVQSSLDGYNVCIFAYGQTGSGKTYTMEGPPSYAQEDVGMIGRAVCQIFQTVGQLQLNGWQYEMKATFIEVYNETIRDLLANGQDSAIHEIRMTEGKNDVYITNLNEFEISDEDEVERLLKIAQKHRAVAWTNCNDRSSRSHSVFQLRLNGSNQLTGENCQGTLNLVDLAGSERLKESQSEGDRLKETKNINKSLSNLGNVIMALSQKAEHIPYRNSKLTHLLMNCLGGNSKTLMFVNISPELEQANETLSSLRFAAKVNQCQIGTATKKLK